MKKRTNAINVAVILDKSGSMSGVQEETIKMFNNYVSELEKDTKAKYRLSLSLFDTVVEKRHSDIPIEETEELDTTTYKPDGWTALYDAIGETVEEMRKRIKETDPALVVVITDGEENSSKKYTSAKIKEMITTLEKGGWKFVYLGANQDSWANTQDLGFARSAVANYNATARGLSRTEQIVARNSILYASASITGSGGGSYDFFSSSDVADLENTK